MGAFSLIISQNEIIIIIAWKIPLVHFSIFPYGDLLSHHFAKRNYHHNRLKIPLVHLSIFPYGDLLSHHFAKRNYHHNRLKIPLVHLSIFPYGDLFSHHFAKRNYHHNHCKIPLVHGTPDGSWQKTPLFTKRWLCSLCVTFDPWMILKSRSKLWGGGRWYENCRQWMMQGKPGIQPYRTHAHTYPSH